MSEYYTFSCLKTLAINTKVLALILSFGRHTIGVTCAVYRQLCKKGGGAIRLLGLNS